jgi:hypothetical protein
MAAQRSSSMGGRPPANAALRGAGLIVLAVLIGVALLSWGFADEGGLIDSGATPTTAPPTGVDDNGETAEPGTDTTLDGQDDTTEPGDVTVEARPREEVTVYVRNGSGVTGAAGRVRDRLNELNYIPRSPDNTPERVTDTAVYYLEGYRPEALRLASDLNIAEPSAVIQSMPVPAPEGTEMGTANLLIILGEDQLISVAAG